ncbi:hypothetical protein H2248_003651 [Termitomyces sp. 'cryptogamus']|nr:hypothetical protein H2248_003651 [Termitomyces sp. 'cryptogamus']
MEVKLDSNVRIFTPEDGDVVVREGVVHSLRTFKGEECVFYERTDPMDEEKEIFFRNLIPKGWPPNFLDMIVAFYWRDGYLAFAGHFIFLEKLFVTLIGGYLAPLWGHKRAYISLKKAE